MPAVSALHAACLKLLRLVGHQKWLRRGIRTHIIRLALKAIAGYPQDFSVSLFGYAYSGTLKNWIDWNIYFFGEYEDEVLQLLRRLAARECSMIFLDVGANVGLHSLFAAKYFSIVHAFEPYPPVRERFLQVVEQNSVENIVVHAVGFGSRDGNAMFFAPPEENLGTGSFLPRYSELNVPFGALRIVVGDEYLTDKVNAVDVIKIDVEGSEADVLKGLRKTLERYRPDIICEISDSTKERLGGLPALLALLPSAYCALDISFREMWVGVFERSVLRLSALDFDRCNNNVLFVPEERIPALRETGFAGI